MARILVLEEAPILCQLLKGVSELLEHEVVLPTSGESRAGLVRARHVDLVIVDVHEVHTMREIREQVPDVRIMVTVDRNLRRADITPAVQKIPSASLLRKPFSIREAADAIGEALS